MTINQISIFLENKYGKLSEILTLLTSENIKIIAATVADTSEYGILRLIVNDTQKAYKILKEANVSSNLTEVFALTTKQESVNFAKLMKCFTDAGLSIEYMYCFSLQAQSIMIMQTTNRELAEEVISHKNMECITEQDLINL